MKTKDKTSKPKIINSVNAMSDEECLSLFLKLLAERITLNTGFIKEEDNDNLTHQVLQVSCGEFTTVSQPEELSVILRAATAEEQGATIN